SIPTPSNDRIYVVHLPPSIQLVFNRNGTMNTTTNPANICAYHDWMRWPQSNSLGQRLVYAVIPDAIFANSGCSGGTGGLGSIDNVALVTSHEIIEAATDPVIDDDINCPGLQNTEIGDCCQQQVNNGGFTWMAIPGSQHPWYVQRPWSDQQQNCGPLQF